jgi:carbamoyltransferase
LVILGIADGPDSSAALVIDGQLIAVECEERLDRTPKSHTFPWLAIKEVLEEAGLRSEHVDLVAVAGRFTPPFFLRRHRGLRKVARDAFSPAMDAQVFYQAMLRQSGFGALEADRAADWIRQQLRAKGFHMQRVVLVDLHQTLAAAAYRCQPDDDVLTVTLHPMGDGVSVAVHRGVAGQVDRLWAQKGFSTLHVHLQRCAAAIGYDPCTEMDRLWAVAARGEPDGTLLRHLDRHLHADGPRLSRRSYPIPSTRGEAVYRALVQADPEVAAASVLENLRQAVCGVVQHHLRTEEIRDVALGGAILDNPRLVAAVSELPEAHTVFCSPFGGYHSLGPGAAAYLGGISPHLLPVPGLGREYHAPQCQRALTMAGLRGVRAGDPAEAAAGLLEAGGAVARFQGRAGLGRYGLGSRTVLVRADEPAAISAVRSALGRVEDEEPGCAWVPTPGDGRVHMAAKLGAALRYGNVAVQVDSVFARQYPGVVTPDGRVHLQRVDPDGDAPLYRTLIALHRRTGCAAVACFPLAEGRDPIVAVPGEAIRVWRRSGLAALWLGPYLVQQEMERTG